jgi:hypothetical protein
MAKFYQHMQPGDSLGKITRLKYIDDISDDELIIYVFEDKSKCSETYIAELNNQNAFNGNYVMAELTDPLNVWKFETKEINLTQTKKVIGADGQEYELPDPGIGVNGEHMTLSLNDDGTPRTTTDNRFAGKRTDAIPPIVKNIKVEPKENYLLSLHPELLTGKKTVDNINLLSHTVKNNIDQDTNTIKNSVEPTYIKKDNIQSPVKTSVIETVKQASITIDIKDILNSGIYNNVNIITEDDTIELSVTEFIDRLLNVNNKFNNVFTDDNIQEDILIKNMIDKSKKTPCTIGVDISLELPPKEVYKTIRDVYPDGMSNEFVNSIARRMDVSELKKSLAEGLISYYEDNK